MSDEKKPPKKPVESFINDKGTPMCAEQIPIHDIDEDEDGYIPPRPVPPGLSRPVLSAAVRVILKWEDNGEYAQDLAIELFELFSSSEAEVAIEQCRT